MPSIEDRRAWNSTIVIGAMTLRSFLKPRSRNSIDRRFLVARVGLVVGPLTIVLTLERDVHDVLEPVLIASSPQKEEGVRVETKPQ